MLSTHFRLALRNLSKNRLYSAINIIGLAVGIAACLLIFRLVSYELSFNTVYRNYDRIARIVTVTKSPEEGEGYTTGIPIPAMDVMQSTGTQFEQFARIRESWPMITVPTPGGVSDKKFNTDDEHEIGVFAEPAFFKIFDWQWLAGDPETALNEVNSVVLSQKMAEKCFDSWQAALGQTLLMDNAILLTVKGVVANAPVNVDFPFHVIIS